MSDQRRATVRGLRAPSIEVRDMRMFFQYAAEVEFREAVERILDRRVVGFLSGIDSEAEIASETFILA